MQHKVNCHVGEDVFTFDFSLGQAVDIINPFIERKFNLSKSSKIVCSMRLGDNQLHAIIQIPLKSIPRDLYFYIMTQAEYQAKYRTITVQDQSDDYPELKFLLPLNSTLKDLQSMFLLSKGYPKEIGIAFSDYHSKQEYSLDYKIQKFLQNEISLMARKKSCQVQFEHNGTIINVLEIRNQCFFETAAEMFKRYSKNLKKQIQTTSYSTISFFYNGKQYPPDAIISPEYESEIKIRIQDEIKNNLSSPPSTFLPRSLTQNREHITDSPIITHLPTRITIPTTTPSIDNQLIFKQVKKQLRAALELADLQQQNKTIKDVLALCLRASMSL